MDSRYIQSFIAVAEFGSVADAARRLDLTPAAVTARIKVLEKDLGVSLLYRSGHNVRLTESGIKMLASAKTVMRSLRDMQATVWQDEAAGELKLGIFPSGLTTILPPVLKGLYQRFPQLSLSVQPGNSSLELSKQVNEGVLDAAIIAEPLFPLGKSSKFEIVYKQPLILLAPTTLAGRNPHELLRTQPFIRYDRSVVGGQLAERYLLEQHIEVKQRLEIDSLMGIAALVGYGLGVALVPDWAPWWSGGLDIARIALPKRPPVRGVGVLWAAHGPRAFLAVAVLSECRRWREEQW